uniref:Putative secreted protein n=1 Tax=Anopheles darlingi TaxID=43151 RepID=A0A2M4DHM5_ANODA
MNANLCSLFHFILFHFRIIIELSHATRWFSVPWSAFQYNIIDRSLTETKETGHAECVYRLFTFRRG